MRLIPPMACSTRALTWERLRLIWRCICVAAPTLLGQVLRPGRAPLGHLTLADVGRVTPRRGFAPVQQFGQHLAVVDIARSGRHPCLARRKSDGALRKCSKQFLVHGDQSRVEFHRERNKFAVVCGAVTVLHELQDS